MSFTISLHKCLNDPNVVPKNLSPAMFELTGTLRNESSVIDPVILVEGDITQYSQCNYMVILSFNRYYYITDMVSIRNNIVEIHAHVDVLQSYKDQFLRLNAIIERQENDNVYNLYLADDVFRVYQNNEIVVRNFPNSLSNYTFVLTVAGPEGVTPPSE